MTIHHKTLLTAVKQAEASPSPPTQRRRSEYTSESEVGIEENGGESDGEVSGGSVEQMVKKLVRLALASEYSRQPLRRADITSKGCRTLLTIKVIH